jgi:hypothetical protein
MARLPLLLAQTRRMIEEEGTNENDGYLIFRR